MLQRTIVVAAVALASIQPLPSSAASFLGETRDALKLLADDRPAEAAGRLARLVERNPRNGELWFQLGHARLRDRQFEGAIEAFAKAADLGQHPPAAMYNVACAYALSGRSDEALAWLGKAIDARFAEDELLRTDKDLDSLRDDPRFREMVGSPPPEGLDRAARWGHDLDYLVRRMEKLHFDLYAKVRRERFASEIDALKRDAAKLSDEQILARLRRTLALVGDGHTRVVPTGLVDGVAASPRYPVDLYLFADGLFVRGAAELHADLVGAKVLKIGGLDAARAMKLAEPFVSVDNEMGYARWTPLLLTHRWLLREIGAVAPASDELTLTIDRRDGRGPQDVTITPTETAPLKLGRFGVAGYAAANRAAAGPVPLYLSHPHKQLWHQYVPERKAMYFFFGRVLDEPGKTLDDAFAELFDAIERNDVRHLVIDMRGNGGGDNFRLKPLLHGLIRCAKIRRDAGLFVIIGRDTYSAAVNGLGLLEWHLDPIFVGEPSAAGPCFVGEGNRILLPCTGHTVTCSSRYWQQWASSDERRWFAPHVPAELTFDDFANNRDPAIEAVWAEIDAATATAATVPDRDQPENDASPRSR